MNICYLVGAGDFFGMPKPKEGDLVIAADGGYDSLSAHGIACDVLIGDLDSIEKRPEGLEIVVFPKEKDETDMFLALSLGVERGYRKFEMYGGTGGREDHTLANYSLLLYAAKRGITLRMYSERGRAEVVSSGEITLFGNTGDTFSVFAFGGDAHGVTITGAKYSVTEANLTAEFPLGVSNEFLSDTVKISVSDGNILVLSVGKA